MPTKKAPAPKSAKRGPATTRALDHAASAAGRRFLREGFAFDADGDLAFALGWPHLRWLVAEHPDDASPSAELLSSVATEGGGYFDTWPSGIANRFVRAFGRDSQLATHSNPHFALPLYEDASAVSAEEAAAWLANVTTKPNRFAVPHHVQSFVFLLEAMHGSEAVLEWTVRAFEAMTKPLSYVEEASDLATCAGLLALRVPEAAAAAAKKRLAAVVEKAVAEHISLRTVAKYIAAAIGGAAEARAIGLHPSFYLNVTDDPRAVVEAAKAGKHLPNQSVRLVFLGGVEVLRAIAPHWKKQVEFDWEQAKLARGLAAVKMPEAMLLLAELAVASQAKSVAAELLRTRADYARPHLEKAAKGASGAVAKKALALL